MHSDVNAAYLRNNTGTAVRFSNDHCQTEIVTLFMFYLIVIISTPSHSEDSITLVLDSGECFVGDLEPMEFMDGYEENKTLQIDWKKDMSFSPRVIHYGHAPERRFSYE